MLLVARKKILTENLRISSVLVETNAISHFANAKFCIFFQIPEIVSSRNTNMFQSYSILNTFFY